MAKKDPKEEFLLPVLKWEKPEKVDLSWLFEETPKVTTEHIQELINHRMGIV